MPLYRIQKPKIFKTTENLVGSTNSPLAFQQPVPERNIDFLNATPTPSNYNEFVITALQAVQDQATILGSNLPVINKESLTEQYIKPIFLGKPGEPTNEYLFANPNDTLNVTDNTDCDTLFIFASMQAKKSTGRGFNKIADVLDNTIPNALTSDLPSDTTLPNQLLFINETSNSGAIQINNYDLFVSNGGTGVGTVVSNPVLFDTWYNKKVNIKDSPTGRNGRWIDYNIGNNVTVGAVNDPIYPRQIGERYNWAFGSIFLTKTFGSTTRNPNETYRELKYVFDPTNGTIQLVDWNYVFTDSPTTFTNYYGNRLSIFGNTCPFVDTEKLTQAQVKNGVVGRKIFTYLIKAFEEGQCIRIDEVYGGIRINVDFNYNGKCCERPYVPSSSSVEVCYPLVPGNINYYEPIEGRVCVQFEGTNGEIGYVKICNDTIPVSTTNGLLTWDYGTSGAYQFLSFNECQGFYTTDNCFYEICFTGYPVVQFTIQAIDLSSQSSYSYSSSSVSNLSMSSLSSSSSFSSPSSYSSPSSQSLLSVSSDSSSHSSMSTSSSQSLLSLSSGSSNSSSSSSKSSFSSQSNSSNSSNSHGISSSSQSVSSISLSSQSLSSNSSSSSSHSGISSKSSRSSLSSNSSSSSSLSSPSSTSSSSSSLSSPSSTSSSSTSFSSISSPSSFSSTSSFSSDSSNSSLSSVSDVSSPSSDSSLSSTSSRSSLSSPSSKSSLSSPSSNLSLSSLSSSHSGPPDCADCAINTQVINMPNFSITDNHTSTTYTIPSGTFNMTYERVGFGCAWVFNYVVDGITVNGNLTFDDGGSGTGWGFSIQIIGASSPGFYICFQFADVYEYNDPTVGCADGLLFGFMFDLTHPPINCSIPSSSNGTFNSGGTATIN